MNLSIGTTFNYDIPIEDQMKMVREVGFTHICLGGGKIDHSDYLSKTGQLNLKNLMKMFDLQICSIHAPFVNFDMSNPNPSVDREIIECFKRCIDSALFLEVRTIVFHPNPPNLTDMNESRKKTLIERINKLLDYIGGENVRLAIENLPKKFSNELLRYSLKEIKNGNYGFCYDSSHDNLTSEPLKILREYGSRLMATHISDNLGENDDHMLPYEGLFKWDKFCELFSTIELNGIFLLEVEMRNSAFQTTNSFLKEAFTRGSKLLKQSC